MEYTVTRKGYLILSRKDGTTLSEHTDLASATAAAVADAEAHGVDSQYLLHHPDEEISVRVIVQGPVPTAPVITASAVPGSTDLSIALTTPSNAATPPANYALDEGTSATGPWSPQAQGDAVIFPYLRTGLGPGAQRFYRATPTDSADPPRSGPPSAVTSATTHVLQPVPFSFVDVVNAAVSTLIVSQPVVISGPTTPVPISVANGEYSIGAGAFTSSPGTVIGGNQVRLRRLSSGSASTLVQATLTVNGVSDTWDITTVATASTHPHPNFPRTMTFANNINGGGYDTQTYIQPARRYNIISLYFYREWENGKALNMRGVCNALKSNNPNNPIIFSYTNVSEKNDAFGDSTAQSEYEVAQKLRAENWYLNTAYPNRVWVTSDFGVSNNVPRMYAITQTLFAPRDAQGLLPTEWFAQWQYDFLVAGRKGDAANDLLDGCFNDNQFLLTRVAGDWNCNGTSDSPGNAADDEPPNQSSLWLRDGLAHYQDYQAQIGFRYQFGNIADWGYDPPRPAIGVCDQTVHGGMLEGAMGFSYFTEGWATFDHFMRQYARCLAAAKAPKMVALRHQFTEKANGRDAVSVTATDPNFQAARYGLACALMKNGYYNPTAGYGSVTGMCWWDEMGFNLGAANASGPEQTGPWSNGIWRRDFPNGTVLMCPKAIGPRQGTTNVLVTPLTVNLGGNFYRLRGTQAPGVNTGSATPLTSFTFTRCRDAIFLAKVPQ